jgi:hypothetical protein
LASDTAAREVGAGDTDTPLRFYPVSTTKLVVLSVCTFGLYHVVWFYKSWKEERQRTDEYLSPAWRSVFAPLFAFSLFTRVRDQATELSVPVGYSPLALAATYFVLSMTWRLPEPYSLISLLAFLPLLPVRAAVAGINTATASHFRAHSLRVRDIVAVVGLWLVVLIAGFSLAIGDKRAYSRTLAEGCVESAVVAASHEAGVKQLCACMGDHVTAHNSSLKLMWFSAASLLNVETAAQAEVFRQANAACGQRHEKAFQATFMGGFKASCIEKALNEGSPEAHATTRCECITRHAVADKTAEDLSGLDEDEELATLLEQAEAACD